MLVVVWKVILVSALSFICEAYAYALNLYSGLGIKCHVFSPVTLKLEVLSNSLHRLGMTVLLTTRWQKKTWHLIPNLLYFPNKWLFFNIFRGRFCRSCCCKQIEWKQKLENFVIRSWSRRIRGLWRSNPGKQSSTGKIWLGLQDRTSARTRVSWSREWSVQLATWQGAGWFLCPQLYALRSWE